MRRKLIVILIAIILGFPIVNLGDLHIAKAEQHYLPEVNQDINVSYVHNIAQKLSNDTQWYLPNELFKGRAFGSKGERYAAEYILAHEMSYIRLYSHSLIQPYRERIGNISHPGDNTYELEVLKKSMTITNISSNPPNTSNVDCFISPRWSREGGRLGIELPRLDKSLLTYNFTYTGLKVHHEPREFDTCINAFINATLEDILKHFNATNFTILEDYLNTSFQHYYNFSFDNITEHPENATSLPFYNATFFNSSIDPFVFIREDTTENPNYQEFPHIHGLVDILVRVLRCLGLPGNLNDNRFTLSTFLFMLKRGEHWLHMRFLRMLPCCKGEIWYDYTNDSHDENPNNNTLLPILYINGSVGRNISNNVNNYRVNFSLNQSWNPNEESYNVIGQINGTNPDPSKTIIINSLYDCWWDQGTADSAIGCGIVLALARKYKELSDSGIRPKQTLKFVLFGGEEYGVRGALSYNVIHPDENITTFIDLNQLGFTQPTPRLTFNIGTNNLSLKELFKQMGEDTNYVARTKDVANFSVLYTPWGLLSDDVAFTSVMNKYRQKTNHTLTITFLKDTGWFRHHRDGINHTEGDTMKYYNSTDVNATANLIFNCTKYYCINPNCSFVGQITYTTKDSPNDDDNYVDTVEADMPLQSILHSDLVRVKAELKKHWWSLPAATVEKDFVINNSVTHQTIDITLPPYKDEGDYYVYLYLYNSTGRLNVIIWPNAHDVPNSHTNSTTTFHLQPRGNEPPTKPSLPNGPTALSIGEKGTWSSTTSDPNHDLVGEKWYTKYLISPYVQFKNTGLYDPESVTPSVFHRFWAIGTHHIKVKAYDQFYTPLHPFRSVSPDSDILDVTVKLCSNIDNPQQLLHQGNILHMVQGISQTFYGSQTGGQSVQWLWDDGNRNRCTQRNATYTFANTETYNITLNATDSQTQITGTATIRVRVSALDSNFNMSYFHGAAPNNPISFRNTSKAKLGNRITNCTWNFGDGTISYQSNIDHTFTQDGDYNVTLTVKDNQNNIDTDYCVLQITSDPMPPEIPDVQSPGTITNASDATILAQVDATDRNLTSVKVQITTPDNTSRNYTMTNLVDDIYIYTLNNSSQGGQYNFTIWATDSENNTNSSSGSYFMSLPFLSYVPPTPEDCAFVNHSWVKVNVTVNDSCNTSAFIDWNRTLKGYWPMDLYDATCIYDNSTYQNYGVFHNGLNALNITTGKYGKGLELDGNDDYVDLGNDTSLNLGTGNFTFMVWEKSHASSYANTTVILSNQPENANMSGYVFGVKNTPFFYTVKNGQSTLVNGAHDVTDNTWHHLAFVRKGTNLSVYVDRVFDAGRTGTLRNITNNKDTCFSYENRTDWYHFDGVLDEAQLYSRALGRDEINASYNNGLYRLCHNFTGLADGTYQYYAHAIDMNGSQGAAEVQQVTVDTIPPTIINVSVASPNLVGFGFNVTINTNVTDDRSGVKNVSVTITFPPGASVNPEAFPLSHISGTMYRYIFSCTWYTGRYNYTIIAYDNASNEKISTVHSFNVSASATMSISTLKDSYGANQYINITDPPNPPENLTLVGRGLTWNTYYNASSGCNILESYQGPVNYQEDNGSWTPINNTLRPLTTIDPAYSYGYRTGNDRGLFGVYLKPDVSSDWPVAFTYNRSDNPSNFVVRSKLVGLGYVDPKSNWAYHYLQSVQSSQGQTNGDAVTYPGVFTGTNITWSYNNTELKEAITMSNTTKTLMQNHPPSLYGLHDGSSYLVFITKLEYRNLTMYNDSGMLTGNVTITDKGVDFRDALGQFKCALPLGEAYELCNESVRQALTYRVVHLNGDTYVLSGLKVSDVTAMIFPVVIDPTLSVNSLSNDGFISKSDKVYNTAWSAPTGTVDSSSTYLSIGQTLSSSTYYVYRGFVMFNTSSLPSNAYLDSAILSLYKKDDFSTTDFLLTIQNGQPTFPHNPLQTSDYSKSLYSGNGGSFNTANFVNGRNNITLTNLSWVNRIGTTKLCLRSSRDISGTTPSGNEYVNVYSANAPLQGEVPKLIITYRNQSKIKNTGSTNIKGYLLIQIQYYNSTQGKWLVEKDTINETSPRTINSGNQLALDTIFNGHVRTNDLTHNNSNYRVYAAFRNPAYKILKTNDGKELAAWWQFIGPQVG